MALCLDQNNRTRNKKMISFLVGAELSLRVLLWTLSGTRTMKLQLNAAKVETLTHAAVFGGLLAMLNRAAELLIRD